MTSHRFCCCYTLIPPSAQGRKRPGKVSASQAEKHLVVFKKICICSLFYLMFYLRMFHCGSLGFAGHDHIHKHINCVCVCVWYYNHVIIMVLSCVFVLSDRNQHPGTSWFHHDKHTTLPPGCRTKKKAVHQFFIILDKNAISCRSASSLSAFDKLFKAHYVFATTYNPMLYNMFTFIQTTVYNIDVGKVKESPRVAEVRARLLH